MFIYGNKIEFEKSDAHFIKKFGIEDAGNIVLEYNKTHNTPFVFDTYQLSKVNERAEIIAEWVKDGYTTGHTSEYIPVKIEEELVHGEKYTVVLERYEDHQMYARKVSD